MVDNRKVKVDFSLEDMDLSEFKGKATYEQIKAYVLEQTGLKVSSLYIAQIKKKCGLDVGENFNLAKSENARQPKCTLQDNQKGHPLTRNIYGSGVSFLRFLSVR